MAGALIQDPDLLLFDEPTNNLDKAGIAHLTKFIIEYPKTCIVISHDADFLNTFTQGVLYLDIFSKKVEQYTGDYFTVVEEIRLRLERERMKNARLEKDISHRKEQQVFCPKNDASTKDIRSRQIDELIRQSEDERRDVYGPNWDDDCKNFYNLFERTRRMPTYRPRISAPQLQLLLLQEAGDSTDTNMRVFIHKKDERDKDREKAFQEHWKKNFFGLQTLMSQVYAQFCGTSFLQVGFDPFANRGKGNVWLRARKQQHVYVDPTSPWPEDWSWICIEDQIYMDRIKQQTPDHTDDIKKSTGRSVSMAGSPAGQLEMPPGPMSLTARGLPTGESYSTDGLMKRRTLYCLDSTMEK